MHLYDSNIPSGNTYKVELLLAFLKIPYQTSTLDILTTPSETRSPEFLKLNPHGQIPVLVLDDGTPLRQSNAILVHLAEGTKFLPTDKLTRTRIWEWLFFEQNSVEPQVAVWKYRTYWGGFEDQSESDKERMKAKGQVAIDVMEQHLGDKEWFVGAGVTIADIALYVYVVSAEVTGFSIGENVKAWLKRVESEKGYVRIKRDPTGKNPW